MPLFILWLAWASCGLVAWHFASRRGFEAWIPWVVSGVIFGPLTIAFAFLVPTPEYEAEEPGGRPRCPNCGRPHDPAIRFCPHCGEAFA